MSEHPLRPIVPVADRRRECCRAEPGAGDQGRRVGRWVREIGIERIDTVYESRPRALAEFDLDVDARIREIAEALHRMSRRLSMRLTKDGDFLESVAHVLECEHQLVNSLRCALGHYDRLLESVFEKVDGIVKPPPHVIDVDYEPEPVTTTTASVEP